MCFGDSKKTTTTNSQTTLPDWLNDASQTATERATAASEKPFQAFTGERVADFNGDSQSAFTALRDLLNGGGGANGAKAYATAPAQTVSADRVVDENGRLGPISDYINPNTAAALTPTLRAINETADAQRKKLGASATAARAFGDARHGIAEGMIDRNQLTATSDAVAKANADAYDKAIAARSTDEARMIGADQTNAQLAETALQRLLTGSTTEQQQLIQQIQAVLSGGEMQRGVAQAKDDAAFQEFLRQYGDDWAKLGNLAQIIKGLPTNVSQSGTQVQSQPDNSGWGALGALGSAYAGSSSGSALISAALAAL